MIKKVGSYLVRKMNPLYHTVWIVFLVVLILMAADRPTHQPIQYNHRLHIEDVGLDCIDCHLNIETNARAYIPNINICGDCHSDTEVDNPEQRLVADFVSENKQIPWVQVHLVLDYAYFSHRRHVRLGQIDCQNCHGDVSQMETPFEKPFIETNMSWCMDCHKERGVTNDCSSCHR